MTIKDSFHFDIHASHLARRVLIEVSPPPTLLRIGATSPSKPPSSSLFFFLGGVVLLLILVILIFVFRKFLKPAHAIQLLIKNPKGKATSTSLWSGNLPTITHFDFDTLKKATKNFHPDYLLGRGGFGPVYKGKLADGRLDAVKKLSFEKSHQGESEFLSEVRMITSTHHKNLVRLLGCCSDGKQQLLVYEYMKNRSLDLIIYGNYEKFLDWNTRFQIILGIARGLQYLHEDSHVRIVHRDIKASNILLEDKFQPRIGDFGLARFFPEDQAYLSTNFVGTLGYTAPEYAIRGELSEKADIYSFGVLLLEIISSRKNTDFSLRSEMQYLPEYAWKLYKRSMVIELVDPRMRAEEGFQEKNITKVVTVALLCLQQHPNLRPPMSEIVSMLTRRAETDAAIPVRPTFMEKSILWDTISEPLPSPLGSESLSISTSRHN